VIDGAIAVVYDDSAPVPAEVAAMTGVRGFGDLLRRQERLARTVERLAEDAGFLDVQHARSIDDLGQIAEHARRRLDSRLYLVLPSHLAPTADRRDAALFLRKLQYLGEPVGLWRNDSVTGAAVLDRDALVAYAEAATGGDEDRERFRLEIAGRLTPVEDALGLADLRELAVALEFLSGSFSARHFNQISQDRYDIVKRSADKDKIRREYRFYSFVPESLQPWFMQPFDYREDDGGASYRTRRMFVPDLAVQWVHGVFNAHQFDQLLGQAFHFIEERPRREVGRDAVYDQAVRLYIDKTRERVTRLLDIDAGRAVDATLRAGGVRDGVVGLLARFEPLAERLLRRRRDKEVAVSHGDFGFSNILYSPATQTFQLVDPRGADTEEEIWSDPLYDVAKLSHSVLGSYDFIVAGLFDLAHDSDLSLRLRIDPAPHPELQQRFTEELDRQGFDVELVRLCEASLFLSMLPLHIDEPRRVAAFALVARDIIEQLEGRA
jgi:hypothetical protein